MRKHRVGTLAIGAVSIVALVVGIAAATWQVPSTRAADADPPTSERLATVMTRNLDDGTDFGSLVSATSVSQFIAAATAEWQEVQASNPPERAVAIAHEIAVARPDFVGIQEAPLWRKGPLQSPPATTVVYDVTQIVLDSLAAQGAPYMVVATTTNLDFEAPTALGYDVRYTDRDVLLARSDLPTSQLKLSNVQAQRFATNLTIPSVVGPITIPESWIAVDATVRGKTYRVVTTHLQANAPAIQLAQATELLQGPANTPLPVVLACDCNSDAANSADPTHATYASLIAAGFVDAWSAAHPSDPGYTWPLHLEDPVGPSTPIQRIDLRACGHLTMWDSWLNCRYHSRQEISEHGIAGRIRSKSRLSRIRLHDLRRMCATLSLTHRGRPSSGKARWSDPQRALTARSLRPSRAATRSV